MSKNKTRGTGNVVPLRTAKETGRASEKKWGKDVIALGFCVVPSLLLRVQNRLGLNPTQLAVLMQLCDFWWERERKPYPSKAQDHFTLAEHQPKVGQNTLIGTSTASRALHERYQSA